MKTCRIGASPWRARRWGTVVCRASGATVCCVSSPSNAGPVSIHPISSYSGCDIVPKDKSDMHNSNNISFSNKILIFDVFQEMADLLILSITELDLMHYRGFAFSIDSHKLDRKKFLNEVFYSRNDLEDPKLQTAVFTSKNIMEVVSQYRLIRNHIQIRYSTYRYIRNVSKNSTPVPYFVSFQKQ